MTDRTPLERVLLADIAKSIECAAGVDDGADLSAAYDAVLKFGGAALADAYDRARASRAGGEG